MTTPAANPRRVRLSPSRDDLVDAGFVLTLMGLALIGFRTTYDGSAYLVVGLAGVVLGIAIGFVADALRQPVIAVVAATLVVFFLAGGAVALRATAIGGVVPSGSTFHGLANESVNGWKDLLTTVPPVSGDGPLLVLPYLLGILGGVGGYCFARRTKSGVLPVVAPFLVLVAVILLGTATPAARLLQGGVFGVVALGWAAYRAHRHAPVYGGAGAVYRLGTAAGLLAIAGVLGSVLGPHLPGLDEAERTVLRSYVTPPTNLDRFPSPLAGFRKYKQIDTKSEELMQVSGLPSGVPIHIAVLDRYDGSVWSASNDPGSSGDGPQDAFRQVGSPIPTAGRGRRISYTVSLPRGGYTDVWMPTAGLATSVRFAGPDAGDDTDSLRYNLATGTGIVLDGLRSGDSYRIDAILPKTHLGHGAKAATADEQLEQSASFVAAKAQSLGGSTGGPLTRLAKIERVLRAGYYSDGLRKDQQQYLPGHSQVQIERFLTNSILVGDDEQYASALALMANSSSIGIPARVVLGAVPTNGVVRGSDVRAWVQIELADGTWRDILPNAFIPTTQAPHVKPPPIQPKSLGQKVPPPVATHPKNDQLDSSAVNSRTSRDKKKPTLAGFVVPGWLIAVGRYVGLPILAVIAVSALLIGTKAWRRRRRRMLGTPAVRFARGWTEVLDHARDLGTRVPAMGTRREQALLLGPGVQDVALTADHQVFGPREPDDGDAAAFWAQVTSARREMSRSVGRRRRWLAAVNPSTLLRRPAIGGAK